MKWLSMLIIVAAGASLLAQTVPGDVAADVVAEARESFDRREFSQTIRQANRGLALKSTAPEQRHELLVLKAESHLRLGDFDLAVRAYHEASATAPDDVSAAGDRAMSLLIRRSRGGVYRSNLSSTSGSIEESYPIIEPAGRNQALRALYDHEREVSAPLLDAVKDASELPPILSALDIAVQLRCLELTATGDQKQAESHLKLLADGASQIIKPRLKKIAARVEKLDKVANSKKKMASAYRKRGLSDEEKTELNGIAEICRQFCDAGDRFLAAPGGGADDFVEIRRDARDLSHRAEQIAGSDYSGLYDRN